jgi:hypothetical protein
MESFGQRNGLHIRHLLQLPVRSLSLLGPPSKCLCCHGHATLADAIGIAVSY